MVPGHGQQSNCQDSDIERKDFHHLRKDTFLDFDAGKKNDRKEEHPDERRTDNQEKKIFNHTLISAKFSSASLEISSIEELNILSLLCSN